MGCCQHIYAGVLCLLSVAAGADSIALRPHPAGAGQNNAHIGRRVGEAVPSVAGTLGRPFLSQPEILAPPGLHGVPSSGISIGSTAVFSDPWSIGLYPRAPGQQSMFTSFSRSVLKTLIGKKPKSRKGRQALAAE